MQKFTLYKTAHMQTYNENVSFHAGQRLDRTIFVFSFALLLDSGTSLTFTYGSASPLGSMGIRFFAS